MECSHPPGGPAGKAGERTYLLLTILSASVLPGQRQGLPQGERLTHGAGEIMKTTPSPPEKRAASGEAHTSQVIRNGESGR